ncbi:dual specificity protein phosphatase 14 isoform X1 [Anguilla rostrata]|uniref:dual specificity protein phosphatase 14 isoform X1 n=2 Tax=Anguilla rostrata TaxID=7938 RepID=UPI0030D55EB0
MQPPSPLSNSAWARPHRSSAILPLVYGCSVLRKQTPVPAAHRPHLSAPLLPFVPMGSHSQGFFHHHHHHHHRSSVVPSGMPRLVPESGGGVLGGIAQITPSLFLSRGNVASNRSLLLSKGITCVVNATIELPNFNWPHVEYVKVPLADMPHSPISLYFDSVADKIHSVGRGKRGAVLVHCAAGVSRSATLCLAYLMKYHRVSLAEAHAWVKARRPVIRPNAGFWRQLIEYERKLFGRNSVKMVQTPYGVVPDVYERDRRNLVPLWGM